MVTLPEHKAIDNWEKKAHVKSQLHHAVRTCDDEAKLTKALEALQGTQKKKLEKKSA